MAEPNDSDLRRSILMGSEVEYDFTCHPCSSGGRNIEAQGYCRDCGVYLCAQCINYHTILPALVHHQIVATDKAPAKQAKPGDTCTERCDSHKDEIIKYFCPIHKVLGCTVCITLKHPTCKNVDYIPDAAADLEDKGEFKAFMRRLDDLIEKSLDTIQHSQDSVQRATDNYDKVLQEVEAYQKEINDRFKVLKDEIRQRAKLIKDTDTATMKSISDEGNKVLGELEEISKAIDANINKKHYCKAYFQMKNIEGKIFGLEKRLKGINQTSATAYEFKRNAELEKTLSSVNGIGAIRVRKWGIQSCTACPVTDLVVKSISNVTNCRITGMCFLTSNTLILVDCNNKTIKLLKIDGQKILAELAPDSYPHGVTKIGHGKAAVTFPDECKIRFLRHDTTKGLVHDNEIKVTAGCLGIDYLPDDKLVVSCNSPKQVRIVHMNGNVMQTFTNDGLFKCTPYLSVNAITRSMFISDWRDNKLVMLDMNGKVKTIYTDDDLDKPKQLAIDGNTGTMFLCGKDSDNVHLLTEDCRKVKILLDLRDGVRKPETVCFCSATRRLYIGMSGSNVVKVFTLA